MTGGDKGKLFIVFVPLFTLSLLSIDCALPVMLCYKTNGKHHSACTIKLWMQLGGLLSTQEARVAYASFVLSNLPRASI